MTQSEDGKEEKGALRADQNQLMFGEGFSFSGYERDPLYLNTGAKKFIDISGVSGIDSITDGRAGVFADFDNDGDLDAAVAGFAYDRVTGAGNMTYQYVNVLAALAAMDGRPAELAEATPSRFAPSPFFLWRAQ